MSNPGAEALQALINYSNETTGESDTTISDAIESLVAGYGGGGETIPKWRDFSGGNILAIIGNGISHIDTGLYLPHNNIVVGVKFKMNTPVGYEYVFGDWCTSLSERFAVQKNAGTSDIFNFYPVTPKYTQSITDATIFEGGIIGRSGSPVATSPLLIFKGYYNDRLESAFSKTSFYGFNAVNIYGEYIAKIVPWKDDNDVICVRNLVTGENYYNAGTGTFGYIDANGVEHV